MESVAGTVTGLLVPLGELLQDGADKLSVSCKTQLVPVAGVQKIVAWPGPAAAIVSVGALGIWTAVGNAQKPPVNAYDPFVILCPASGCPIVPLTEYTPPVLVPPPPSIVCQSMEYCPRT